MGNRTNNAANLPVSATYRGTMLGQFVGGSNTPYDTLDTPQMTVDFRSGDVTMTGSPLSYNALNGNVTPATGLAYTANGRVTGTAFQGTMNANLGGLTGTFSGNFYGPNGEQSAGTFGMSGASGSHVAAFILNR